MRFQKMKELIKNVLPQPIWDRLGHYRKKFGQFYFESLIKLSKRAGLYVYPISDIYSPLHEISLLKKNTRWKFHEQEHLRLHAAFRFTL